LKQRKQRKRETEHADKRGSRSFAEILKDLLLEHYSPTGLLVDPEGDIIQIHGRTGKYLETVTGPGTQKIVDMAREGLKLELSTAMRKAAASDTQVVRRGVRVKTNGKEQKIALHVVPVHQPEEVEGLLLVVFKDTDEVSSKKPETGEEADQARVSELEKELKETSENLQPVKKELKSGDDKWYNMKITPYRTTENTVDGAVISFGDITDQKRTQWELERLSREKEKQREIILRAVFDMNEQPLTVLDYEGRIFIANKSFSQWFGKDIKSLEGDVFFELVSRSVGKSLKDQLKELMDKRSNFKIGPFRDRIHCDRNYPPGGSCTRLPDSAPDPSLGRKER
jgi:transcriptional regulator with PAS, ATPase and Fis domain